MAPEHLASSTQLTSRGPCDPQAGGPAPSPSSHRRATWKGQRPDPTGTTNGRQKGRPASEKAPRPTIPEPKSTSHAILSPNRPGPTAHTLRQQGSICAGKFFFSPLFSNQNRNNFQSIITISFLNRQMFPFKPEGGKSKGQHFKPKRKTKINFLFYRKIKYNSSKKPGFPFPKRTTNGTTGSSLPLMPP